MMYQCNRANQDEQTCRGCYHSTPHKKSSIHSDKLCTKWEECYLKDDTDGKEIVIKVRCVRVK